MEEVSANLERLAIRGADAHRVAQSADRLRRADSGPLECDEAPFPDWEYALLATSPRADVRERTARQFARSRVRLVIGGDDLLRAGVPAGPWVGEALRRVLRARRDRTISAGEELAFAVDQARTMRPA
jgi:hypothetical protein